MKHILPAILLLFMLLSCKPNLSGDTAKYSYGFGYQIGTILKNKADFDHKQILAGVKDAIEGKDAQGDKSRTIGHNIGKNYTEQGIPLDIRAFSLGVNEGYEGAEPSVKEADMRQAMESIIGQINGKNLKAGAEYLAKNREKEGVTVTASGLQYRTLVKGAGRKPGATETVKVHYTGRLISGKVFDSSYTRNQPAVLPLDKVIRGWSEGVQLMNVGSKFEFTIPPDLGYGAQGAGTIPGNSVLIFDVELLEINRK